MNDYLQGFFFMLLFGSGAFFLAFIGQLLLSVTAYIFRGLVGPSDRPQLRLYTWRDVYVLLGQGPWPVRALSRLLWVFSVYAVYLVIFPLVVMLVAAYAVSLLLEGERA